MHHIIARRQLAALFALVAPPAIAQVWPTRPVRLVVGFAPGGLTDVIARIMAQGLSDQLGQAVVVENRAGAGGNVGTDAVARAAPDGYTLLAGFDGTFTINPHLYTRLPFDPVRDFAPIAKIADVPVLVVGHPSLPGSTLADVVAHARANPGAVTYASGGVGTTGHLLGELICQQTGVRMDHVPFRGGGQAVSEVLAGRVSMLFAGVPAGIGFVQSGQLRGLAVSSADRVAVLAQVPSMAEQGLGPIDVNSWVSLMAPARTPPDVLTRLRAAAAIVLADPAIQQRLREQGGTPGHADAAAFARQMAQESERWRQVIRAADIRL
jgi:tripartite-type tricarboxylate transporter receptor subunit TctC